MKKTSIQRVLSECINLVMALLLVIPLGIAVEQFLGYPLFRCGLLPCLSGIGYVLARYQQLRKWQGEVVLCNLTRLNQTIFEMSGIFQIIRYEKSEGRK